MTSTRRKRLVLITVLIAVFLLWWFASEPKHEVRYTVADLGAGLRPSDINDRGEVLLNHGAQTYVWSATRGLTEICHKLNSIGTSINHLGEVAGIIMAPPIQYIPGVDYGRTLLPLWEPQEGLSIRKLSCGFVRDALGGITVVDLPAGWYLSKGIINNSGSVVWDRDIYSHHMRDTAYRWDATTGAVEISSASGKLVSVIDSNDAGEVIGHVVIASDADGKPKLARWDPVNGIQLLEFSIREGEEIHPKTLLASGQIGGIIRGRDKIGNPFLWDGERMLKLETFGGKCHVSDMNEKLQIVGNSTTRLEDRLRSSFDSWDKDLEASGKAGRWLRKNVIKYDPYIDKYHAATLWENGQVYNLNDLIRPRSGWVLKYATAINEVGQIVGGGEYRGKSHTFLLTPIKEETTAGPQ